MPEARAATPAQIFVSHTSEDDRFADALEVHLAPLIKAGEVRLWDHRKIMAGEAVQVIRRSQLDSADIVLLLVSPSFLASDQAHADVRRAMVRATMGEARVIPILVRPCLWEESAFGRLAPLPRDLEPIGMSRSQDAAWAEVATELRSILQYRAGPAMRPPARPPQQIRQVHEIFRTSDISEVTYVEPAQFKRLRAYMRVMGQGLVVEGPSGVGKSTIVKSVLRDLGVKDATWLFGQEPADREALDRMLKDGFVGHLVIDDFHRLDAARQARVADAMKVISDVGTRDSKITAIGINPVGDSLISALRDLTGRFQTIAMGKQPDDKIAELVSKGEAATNIVFRYRDELIVEAGGSFFIAQQLCYEACLKAEIFETAPELTYVGVAFRDVMDVVIKGLEAPFFGLLRVIACHDDKIPPRGAGLALLWLLARSKEGHTSLEDVHFQFTDPQVRDGLTLLKSSYLQRCFDDKPELKSLFYYNKNTGVLSIEDSRLSFYLRHMSWPAFLTNTGYKHARIDQEGSLVFSKRATSDRPAAKSSLVHVLHLSDLHFSDLAQADVWYGQLAEDLRELECDQIDAVVLSGDLTQRADRRELEASQRFLLRLGKEYRISPAQVLLVPGNHDLSWTAAKAAYSLHRRAEYSSPLEEGSFIAHGTEVVEVRDAALWGKRFESFSEHYSQIKGIAYPLDYEDQFEILDLPKENLLLLGLNSAWEIDHNFTSRASIHMGALTKALASLRANPHLAKRLKIAVWHHPLNGAGEDRIKDHGFLQQLAKAGFRLVLHGHIHKAERGLFRYDMSPDGRRLEIVSAGTFGAPTREWVSGVPLQYNLLRIAKEKIIVETRRREEPNGAWQPDARWLHGKSALSYYEVALSSGESRA